MNGYIIVGDLKTTITKVGNPRTAGYGVGQETTQQWKAEFNPVENEIIDLEGMLTEEGKNYLEEKQVYGKFMGGNIESITFHSKSTRENGTKILNEWTKENISYIKVKGEFGQKTRDLLAQWNNEIKEYNKIIDFIGHVSSINEKTEKIIEKKESYNKLMGREDTSTGNNEEENISGITVVKFGVKLGEVVRDEKIKEQNRNTEKNARRYVTLVMKFKDEEGKEKEEVIRFPTACLIGYKEEYFFGDSRKCKSYLIIKNYNNNQSYNRRVEKTENNTSSYGYGNRRGVNN